jgi:3-hydroxyisobutyrate dehydrogenase
MAERPSLVGFVGLGNMGWPMAHNLAAAGFALVVRDANPDVEKRFADEHGARVAPSASDFADATVVVTMLPDERVVADAVLAWDGGIAAALQRGAVVVDMSSSNPIGTQALAPQLAARGVALVDAPVSGGIARAGDGTLSIMIGADDEDAVARALPVLEVLGERLFRTGASGSAHAMKALNNYVGGAAFVATCEALVAGTKFGLDPAVMVDILNVSTGRNFTTMMAAPNDILPRTFGSGFALALFTKDIGIAADLADELGIDAPVSRLVHERMRGALEQLDEVVDHTMAMTVWEQAAGVTVAPHERTS